MIFARVIRSKNTRYNNIIIIFCTNIISIDYRYIFDAADGIEKKDVLNVNTSNLTLQFLESNSIFIHFFFLFFTATKN